MQNIPTDHNPAVEAGVPDDPVMQSIATAVVIEEPDVGNAVPGVPQPLYGCRNYHPVAIAIFDTVAIPNRDSDRAVAIYEKERCDGEKSPCESCRIIG